MGRHLRVAVRGVAERSLPLEREIGPGPRGSNDCVAQEQIWQGRTHSVSSERERFSPVAASNLDGRFLDRARFHKREEPLAEAFEGSLVAIAAWRLGRPSVCPGSCTWRRFCRLHSAAVAVDLSILWTFECDMSLPSASERDVSFPSNRYSLRTVRNPANTACRSLPASISPRSTSSLARFIRLCNSARSDDAGHSTQDS